MPTTTIICNSLHALLFFCSNLFREYPKLYIDSLEIKQKLAFFSFHPETRDRGRELTSSPFSGGVCCPALKSAERRTRWSVIPTAETNPHTFQEVPMIQTHFVTPITRVRVVGYTYLVDLGPLAQPRFHTVNKQRRCSCQLKETCPAIEAVAEYLCNGGKRAPDPMPPCPLCGAETFRDRNWDGKYTKELGWRCTQGGLSHFLQTKALRIIQA
jgi:hypothetical protein